MHVGAFVEKVADGLRVCISERPDQGSPGRFCLMLIAGANRSRRKKWELGPSRQLKNRDCYAQEQQNRDCHAQETLVTYRTTHDATPIQGIRNKSALASGATTPPDAAHAQW
jgi:hypothetical protein